MIANYFKVIPIEPKIIHEWLLKKHYAHRKPTVQKYGFALVERKKNTLIGIATFGYSPNKNLGGAICGEKYGDFVLEFNRLCIDYQDRRNLASWFCAKAIGMLPKPLILVSYSDQNQGHVGYIYQALNWIYTGEGAKNTPAYILNNGTIKCQRAVTGLGRKKSYEGKIKKKIILKPKHRYVYFHGDKRWKKEAMAKLKFSILPYPKGESERYDDTAKVKAINLGFGLIPIKPLKNV